MFAVVRFIPTYVGHTLPDLQDVVIYGGSSPHTWGIRRNVGKCSAWCPVHPHIRGAYFSFAASLSRSTGSSPHTWGIPGVPKRKSRKVRFIPTYVGHTMPPPSTRTKSPVHPHIRGAYISSRAFALFRIGSSPHTWGILLSQVDGENRRRFIPTYVGHTPISNLDRPVTTVHPHIRGAYGEVFLRLNESHGSSPHTWGILFCLVWGMNRARFIPTYVGHTKRTSPVSLSATVHPHIRGAYTGPP